MQRTGVRGGQTELQSDLLQVAQVCDVIILSALAHQQQYGHRLPAHSVPVRDESAGKQEDWQKDRQQQRGVNVLRAMVTCCLH
jgi:hypothetical protein